MNLVTWAPATFLAREVLGERWGRKPDWCGFNREFLKEKAEAARKDNAFSEFYQRGERSTHWSPKEVTRSREDFVLNGGYCCMFVADRKGAVQKKQSRGEKKYLQVPVLW